MAAHAAAQAHQQQEQQRLAEQHHNQYGVAPPVAMATPVDRGEGQPYRAYVAPAAPYGGGGAGYAQLNQAGGGAPAPYGYIGGQAGDMLPAPGFYPAPAAGGAPGPAPAGGAGAAPALLPAPGFYPAPGYQPAYPQGYDAHPAYPVPVPVPAPAGAAGGYVPPVVPAVAMVFDPAAGELRPKA